MLSPDTEQKLADLRAGQHIYRPNSAIAAQLKEKVLIMLVGPACVGKTAIIQQVTKLDDRFGITGTFTTRDKRADDQSKNYTYIPHDDEGIGEIYQKINRGEAVQYAVHPTSCRIYGSDIRHYPKAYDLLDTLYSAVAAIEALPARETIVIGVAVEPKQWIEWLDARFPPSHPDRQKRCDEAAQSLSWLLQRPEGLVRWVINTYDELDQAAEQVIAIATHRSLNDETGRNIAEAMLATIEDIAA